MAFRYKIIASFLLIAVANLVFYIGQTIYYDRQVDLASASRKVDLNKSIPDITGRIKTFKFVYQNEEFSPSPSQLKKWRASFFRTYYQRRESRINWPEVTKYLQVIAGQIDKPMINARLVVEKGKVKEFSPAQSGIKLNLIRTLGNVSLALADDRSQTQLALDQIEPEVTLDKANDLGINTLLARGESNFAGSPKFRIHNIGVGAGIFNGLLLKPGEKFSFNNSLGAVTASTGYLPELVIKNKTIVAEYGGGLCQVSTTLFRAAVAAGLPILERHSHSLPVRYYNPQGYDATIYPGVADLKFANDTPGYILIQSRVAGSKILFEIYGTRDSRQVVIDGPRQYDAKPDGALKASLTRVITLPDGQTRKDVFLSNYKSPSLYKTIKNPYE